MEANIKKKKKRYSGSDISFNIVNYLIFGLFTLICVYPFYYLIINTISANDLSANGAINFLPKGFHLENYKQVLQLSGLGTAALVSLGRIVKDKFNMELNIIAPNVAGGGDTLFQTRSAAGDLGDLILTNADGGRLQNLVTAGLVMDMTDLLADKENVHRYDSDYTLWDSVLAENNTALNTDWQEKMGAKTTMEYLQNNNKILVAPGSGFAAPEEDSQITTLRGQCKATIVDTSWQMIFAANDEEFDTLQKTMQDTLEGLDYQTVLDYDMDLAKQQNDARVAIVEEYANADTAEATPAADSASAASSSSAAAE